MRPFSNVRKLWALREVPSGSAGPVNPMPWSNHHYEEPRSFLIQFLRSGDRRFFDEGEIGMRHHADIDTQHSPGPNRYAEGHATRPNPGPGFVWMHYSHDHQGLGHISHFHLGGMPQYFLLQGDLRARDVITETADHVVNLIENPPPEFSVEYSNKPKDKAAREDAVARFSNDRVVPMYEGLYQDVLNGGSTREG